MDSRTTVQKKQQRNGHCWPQETDLPNGSWTLPCGLSNPMYVTVSTPTTSTFSRLPSRLEVFPNASSMRLTVVAESWCLHWHLTQFFPLSPTLNWRWCQSKLCAGKLCLYCRSANYTPPGHYIKCFHNTEHVLTLHNHYPTRCLGKERHPGDVGVLSHVVQC